MSWWSYRMAPGASVGAPTWSCATLDQCQPAGEGIRLQFSQGRRPQLTRRRAGGRALPAWHTQRRRRSGAPSQPAHLVPVGECGGQAQHARVIRRPAHQQVRQDAVGLAGGAELRARLAAHQRDVLPGAASGEAGVQGRAGRRWAGGLAGAWACPARCGAASAAPYGGLLEPGAALSCSPGVGLALAGPQEGAVDDVPGLGRGLAVAAAPLELGAGVGAADGAPAGRAVAVCGRGKRALGRDMWWAAASQASIGASISTHRCVQASPAQCPATRASSLSQAGWQTWHPLGQREAVLPHD